MSSPEFQQQLQEAKEFRRIEAGKLRGMERTKAGEYLKSLRQQDTYIQARQMVLFERWEILGKKIPEFTKEQWEETGQVLSGLNNGVKAGLFLAIAQNTPLNTYMPTDDIVESFKEMFAGTELLEVLSEHSSRPKSVVIEYCRQSLCDVGLLAEEYKTDDWGVTNFVGFAVTERGRRIGIPAALSVLWYENESYKSLYSVLGRTASRGGTRAPLNRARILDYVIRHPYEVREADLITALELDLGITENSLKYLRNYGVIDYKAVTTNTGKTQIRYKKVEGKNLTDADHHSHYTSLQDQIVRILESIATAPISIGDILGKFHNEFKKNRKEKGLKIRVNIILNYLLRQGYLTRVEGFKGGERQSDASLYPKGRDLYFRLIYPTLLLSSGETLPGNCLAHLNEAKDNLTLYAQNSAELYYPHSTSSKIRKYRENKLQVLEILQGSPDLSFTVQDLSERMGLDSKTIRNYLKPQIPGSTEITVYLDKETPLTIQREKIKGVWYFRIKKPDDK